MADDSSLTEIAHRLYGLPLGEFIAARNAAAKDAGGDVARYVKAFRKSAAGAHLVNLLVRADGELLDDVRDLGVRLRSAQAESDAAGLRSLDRERRALVSRSVTAAAAVAENAETTATDASLRDVEQTVWAALVDAGAFATMQAGTLLRPLSPNGFGSVDLDGASAVEVDVDAVEAARPARSAKAPAAPPASKAEKTETKKDDGDELRARREAKAAAQREVDEAQAELAAADDAVTEASDAINDSERRVADLKAELAELRERISQVETSLRDERDAQSDRRSDLRAAEKARRTAATAADRALRRQGDV